jgi:hypothetical protein
MGTKRLTYAQAAHALGISIDATRMRVRRGTLRSERDGSRVFVILDADQVRPDPDDTNDALNEHLREEVEFLREELRRKDHILAALVSRAPALEPPSDERADANASREETAGRYPSTGSREGSEKPASWWSRLFR